MDVSIKKHRKEMTKKIKNLRSNNSKEFWTNLQSAPNHGFELIHTFLFLFLNGLPAIPNVSFADDTDISPILPTRVLFVNLVNYFPMYIHQYRCH
jgi:hypothetical protein